MGEVLGKEKMIHRLFKPLKLGSFNEISTPSFEISTPSFMNFRVVELGPENGLAW